MFEKKVDSHKQKFYWYLIGAIWTLAAGTSLVWNIYSTRSQTMEAAILVGRTAIEKDVIYRRWNSESMRVYAQASYALRPNSYLNSSNRDIQVGSNMMLTMVNPAYMTRLAHEIQDRELSIRGHITSLKPIRPANRPDEWEASALQQLESDRNVSEVSKLEYYGNRPYMRVMRPLIVEASCLKCHLEQGYKLGDVRGGISATIPISRSVALMRSQIMGLVLGHALLWGLGITGIVLTRRRVMAIAD